MKARIRDAVDFPLAGVAVALRREGDRIAGLKVAITGANSAPLLVPTDELVGGCWDAAAAGTLSQRVRRASNVLKTTVTGVGYRRRALLALGAADGRRALAGRLNPQQTGAPATSCVALSGAVIASILPV